MNNKTELLSAVSHQFSLLRDGVRNRKPANDHSWSVYAETLIAELMNVIFDLKLRNRNIGTSQAKGFDLDDPIKHVVVQVTSSNDNNKIHKTAKAFSEKKWAKYKAYIVIIDDAPLKKINLNQYTRFRESGHILNLENLYGLIAPLEIAKIIEIIDLLKAYLGAPRQPRMLSTSVLDADPYTQKVTFANYANRYCFWVEKCIRPPYHDPSIIEATYGELDLELYWMKSSFWATRIKEFPVAFISKLDKDELATTQQFLSACQCRLKSPQKCRSKIPQLCRRRRHGELGIFRRPTAWTWRRR
ncbi:SMEK domain-containing protein, partial [Ensifer sp. ENS12]|uniref:SMEK domain-containing protein n=1 Tax=Ensifer sp. ENS12 TaxID=2854774 RepID=UPI001C44DF41